MCRSGRGVLHLQRAAGGRGGQEAEQGDRGHPQEESEQEPKHQGAHLLVSSHVNKLCKNKRCFIRYLNFIDLYFLTFYDLLNLRSQ